MQPYLVSLRRSFVRATKALFLALGVYDALRRLRPNPHPAILRFHAVAGAEARAYASPGITVAPDAFEQIVRYLTDRHTVCSMDDLSEHLRGERRLCPNSVILTFDDGYRDNLTAVEILLRYGLTATIYLTADRLGHRPPWMVDVRRRITGSSRPMLEMEWGDTAFRLPLRTEGDRDGAVARITRWIKSRTVADRDAFLAALDQAVPLEHPEPGDRVMLDWAEVEQMARRGVTFGAHTLTHANLPHATDQEASAEIRGSSEAITRALGIRPRHFAYPNGGAAAHVDDRAKRHVRASGFETAVTSRYGFVAPGSDSLELRRIPVSGNLAELAHSLSWWRGDRTRV